MELLKMRSARVIKAPGKPKDPEEAEMAARARAVMRQLRGVKLNLSDERITFDDVAGIGEAKARAPDLELQTAAAAAGSSEACQGG